METHKVLLIGGGGREHAMAWAISTSPLLEKLYIAPGNPGTAQHGENVDLDVDDFDAVIDFLEEKGVNLVVVGPEKPLVNGITDYLEDYGFRVFGPSKAAAQLEGSKSFAKSIMKKYGIPTAGYKVFERHEVSKIDEYLSTECRFPIVLKVDGLAAGKGVFIGQSLDEARSHLETILNDVTLSAAADFIVVEEFMQGEEVSVFAISDGTTARLLMHAQDHKRIGNNDTGLNTGGMGAYCPAPVLDEAGLQHVMDTIIQPTIDAMAAEETPYKGVLYAGLMMTPDGPSVVEYNCRFGDPECQAMLPALKNDLLEIMLVSINGKLEYGHFDVDPGYFCSVVMASGGYPGAFEKGFPISGLETLDSGIQVFHSGTRDENGVLVTNGGRVLNVVGRGETLEAAIHRSYSAVKQISFKNAYYRSDIGAKGLNYFKK